MKEDPPIDAKCRDKFLVQSVIMKSDDVSNVAAIWSDIEKTAKSSIQERKIRVNFLPADGALPHTNGVAAPTRQEEEPPAYSSPSPQFGSPATHSAVTSREPKNAGTQSSGDTNASSSAAGPSTIASAAAAVSNAVPKSQEDLKQQLADAKTQISKLTSQLGDPQLRQRKVQEAGEKMQTVVQQTGETGVPVQIVAGLCLLSFLLAYFFF
jgi:cobalamin biosynthesis Mg chelatase CobN